MRRFCTASVRAAAFKSKSPSWLPSIKVMNLDVSLPRLLSLRLPGDVWWRIEWLTCPCSPRAFFDALPATCAPETCENGRFLC